MGAKLGLSLIVCLIQAFLAHGQREWVPSSMTAAEMWNPATWYYPYGIAASEAWTNYLQNAQQATNQLYQQWHATGAAYGWWSGGQSNGLPGGGGGGGGGGGSGGGGGVASTQGGGQGAQGAAGQAGQAGQAAQGTAGNPAQAG